MKFYKQEILNRLAETGWELVSTDDPGDWWLEEFWVVRSTKQNWGTELYLYFLVDPQYDGNNKGSAVWTVEAFSAQLTERPVGNQSISELYLQKGKFKENIGAFLDGINSYRNNQNT